MVTGEGGGGGTETTTKISAEDWPLIEPSQVNVAMPPVHTAESMLTPLGNQSIRLSCYTLHIIITYAFSK